VGNSIPGYSDAADIVCSSNGTTKLDEKQQNVKLHQQGVCGDKNAFFTDYKAGAPTDRPSDSYVKVAGWVAGDASPDKHLPIVLVDIIGAFPSDPCGTSTNCQAYQSGTTDSAAYIKSLIFKGAKMMIFADLSIDAG
jgi:hypothetical protein